MDDSYDITNTGRKRHQQTRNTKMQKAHISKNDQAQCGSKAGCHGIWVVSIEEFKALDAKHQCSKCAAKIPAVMTDERRAELKKMWAACKAETKARMDKRMGR